MSERDNPERRPVMLASDLDTLDHTEIVEGYLDGLCNEPCGGNRSRSYWHGWRNGMVDKGHAKSDAYQLLLARDVVARRRIAAIVQRESPTIQIGRLAQYSRK